MLVAEQRRARSSIEIGRSILDRKESVLDPTSSMYGCTSISSILNEFSSYFAPHRGVVAERWASIGGEESIVLKTGGLRPF